MSKACGEEKVRVDYVTVDGRETYWFIEWEGVLAAVMRRYQEAQSDTQREKLRAATSRSVPVPDVRAVSA